MLGRHDGSFDKHARVHDEARSLFGLNLFSADYGQWKPRRRMLQPIFTPNHVASFARHMSEAIHRLTHRWQHTATVDLNHEMRRLTLRVLGRTLFGRSLDWYQYHSDGCVGGLSATFWIRWAEDADTWRPLEQHGPGPGPGWGDCHTVPAAADSSLWTQWHSQYNPWAQRVGRFGDRDQL